MNETAVGKFDHLQVGDVVILHPGGYCTWPDSRSVVKITPTQIHLAGYNPTHPIKCRKSDGRVMGESSGWGGAGRIEIATDEAIEKIRRRKLSEKVKSVSEYDWQLLSSDRLAEILGEIKKAKGAKP